jgi:hypothetical protein
MAVTLKVHIFACHSISELHVYSSDAWICCFCLWLRLLRNNTDSDSLKSAALMILRFSRSTFRYLVVSTFKNWLHRFISHFYIVYSYSMRSLLEISLVYILSYLSCKAVYLLLIVKGFLLPSSDLALRTANLADRKFIRAFMVSCQHN